MSKHIINQRTEEKAWAAFIGLAVITACLLLAASFNAFAEKYPASNTPDTLDVTSVTADTFIGGTISGDISIDSLTDINTHSAAGNLQSTDKFVIYDAGSTANNAVTWDTVILQMIGDGGLPQWQNAPGTASTACTANQVAYDTNYLYICVATNTWLRVTIATW